MKLRSVTEIGDIAGKKVLLRLDLNVPIKDGVVADDFRIRKSLPTVQFLASRGAKLIIISHCEGKESSTLRPAFEYLKQTLPISFVEQYFNGDTIGADTVAAVENLKSGEMVLLENLRTYEGEKANSEALAKSLASLADFYVNDAFSASHRKHASIIGIPKYIPGYAGLLLQSEVEHLSKSFTPPHPFLFVLGGAKFDTKIPLIKKFLEIADEIFVGGALANNFFKEMGYEVGTSTVSDGNFGLAEILKSKKILLPIDVVVKAEGKEEISIKSPKNITEDESMLDVGSETMTMLSERVEASRYVLWNGPLGNFEMGFDEATTELARKISESTAESVVGGADTLAAIAELGLEKKFNFVSSGGGAMLDFLANGTLPGIEALEV